MVKIDRTDIKILNILQEDASLSIQELAERVALSTNACWRRTKILEEEGVIKRRVALVSAKHFGLNVVGFVMVRTNQHTESWLAKFAQNVTAIPEVVEIYRMSGEIDYLLKVLVRDIADYDRLYKKLIKAAPMSDVSSSFAMEQIKCTTALPLSSSP